jgi:hypothetical protein
MSWQIKRTSVKFVDFGYVEVGLTNYVKKLFNLSNNCSGLYEFFLELRFSKLTKPYEIGL